MLSPLRSAQYVGRTRMTPQSSASSWSRSPWRTKTFVSLVVLYIMVQFVVTVKIFIVLQMLDQEGIDARVNQQEGVHGRQERNQQKQQQIPKSAAANTTGATTSKMDDQASSPALKLASLGHVKLQSAEELGQNRTEQQQGNDIATSDAESNPHIILEHDQGLGLLSGDKKNTYTAQQEQQSKQTPTTRTTTTNTTIPIIPQHPEETPPTEEQQNQPQKIQEPKQQQQQQEQPKLPPATSSSPYLATLNCDALGGPSAELAQEMVYWKQIPADYDVVSPFFQEGTEQFLTFEPDAAGWNNKRMAMETILATAFAMGRTIVLPPEQEIDALDVAERDAKIVTKVTNYSYDTHPNITTDQKSQNEQVSQQYAIVKKKQKTAFSFNDFFHLYTTTANYKGLKVITTQEFLEEQIMTGNFWKNTNRSDPVLFPPGNRTDWNGAPLDVILSQLFPYYRKIMPNLNWDPDICQLAFANGNTMEDLHRWAVRDELLQQQQEPMWYKYVGNPVPVDASTYERLKETRGDRTSNLCLYMPEIQRTTYLHYPSPPRLLMPFYGFVFFEDWNYQLFLNRLIRDTVRYNAEITCAAARVVAAIRKRVLERTGGASSSYHAIHIRRGDFKGSFPETFVDIQTIHSQLSRILPPHDSNLTLYIATDDKSKDFFDYLRQHYDIVFLDDFKDDLGDVNTNYYGMIDQLIASRSRYFFGCFSSTFSAYINRLRGYHHDNNKGAGYEHGIIDSWYYAPANRFDEMRHYQPLRWEYWQREYPMGWRMSEYKMEEFHQTLSEKNQKQEQ